MKLLIGADPEIFLTKTTQVEKPKRDNINPPYPTKTQKFKNVTEFVSAYGLIPGTKKEPFKVENGAVQVDGMALEFNIDPVDNADQFVYNINSVVSQLRKMVPDQFEFSKTVSVNFDGDYYSKQPAESLVLGCDPDFNAYSERQNMTVNPDNLGTLRMVGGHIHLGWTEGQDVTSFSHFSPCCQLARQLDYYLGLPAIFLDKDATRNRWYGKAGNFRPKPYGMEYRTLSNFWINEEKLQRFVFKQATKAFNKLVDDDLDMFRVGKITAQNLINYRGPWIERCNQAFHAFNFAGVEKEDMHLFDRAFASIKPKADGYRWNGAPVGW